MHASNASGSRSAGALRPSLASLILTLMLSLLGIAPAHADSTFGRQTIATIPSAGMTANFKRGSRFTASTSGLLTGLCAYVDGLGGAGDEHDAQNFRLSLYADHNGTPAARVAESIGAGIYPGVPPRWFCLSTDWTPITPGQYWIVIHTGDTQGILRDYGDGAANWFGNSDAFGDGGALTFGAGNAGSGTLSVYATVDTQSHVAGRTTIGTTPSKGMTADFKRGSRFTLTEPALLDGMSVYLDGLGGGSGVGVVRGVLYRDENGVPGAKVGEGYEVYVSAGSPVYLYQDMPSWRSSAMDPTLLEPGKYWLALHTRSAGGIFRNYADGSGNWVGNADPYIDGASDPFGPSAAGNGTLSAFVRYRAGPFTKPRFGRTGVGSVPSKGLTADFTRGSTFLIHSDTTKLVASALYAYIDGNGGAAGTQSLRMALYGAEPRLGTFRYAQSDVVTIAAGTPPGWVRFPIPLTNVDGQYMVTIQSGGTSGIVRDYGGNGPNNWFGESDEFADGAMSPLDMTNISAGTGTLSVYVECIGAQ